MTDTINQSEAARRLGVDRRTVAAAIRDGRLRSVRRKGRREVLVISLEGFETNRAGRPRKRVRKPRACRTFGCSVIASGDGTVFGNLIGWRDARDLADWLTRYADWAEQQEAGK